MAWTLVPIMVEHSHDYLRWKVRCISDGSALATTDLFSETYMPRDMKTRVQGHTYMRMDYVPHKAAQAPNDTCTITLANSVGTTMFSSDTAVADADETFDLSTDISMYPTFYAHMYLTVTDIGDAGDYFDLYFEVWKESGNA